VAEQVGVSGDCVLEMESLICDVDRIIIEAKLAVNVNTTAVQKVVNICNDKGALENVTDKEIVTSPVLSWCCAPTYASPVRLLPYLYLPDRSTAYTGLTSAVAAISMLSSYRPNTSTSVRTMPTFLFRLTFPRLSNHSLASCYESSPVFLVRVSQFFVYLLRFFCYLLSTILRISQPISKLLTHFLTVL
jgi:hypothetical protein